MKNNWRYAGAIIALFFICAAFVTDIVVFIGVVVAVLGKLGLVEVYHDSNSISDLLGYFVMSIGGFLATVFYFRKLNSND